MVYCGMDVVQGRCVRDTACTIHEMMTNIPNMVRRVSIAEPRQESLLQRERARLCMIVSAFVDDHAAAAAAARLAHWMPSRRRLAYPA